MNRFRKSDRDTGEALNRQYYRFKYMTACRGHGDGQGRTEEEMYLTPDEVFVKRLSEEKLLTEFELIQQKKSCLSSTVRAIIVGRVQKLQRKLREE